MGSGPWKQSRNEATASVSAGCQISVNVLSDEAFATGFSKRISRKDERIRENRHSGKNLRLGSGATEENRAGSCSPPISWMASWRQQLESADALIVRSAVQADAELLAHAKKLRVIGRAGVGVDNIDLDAATRQGIAVMNTPGANAVAVAEQTLGMMLAMARHLCRADALMHAGKWEKKSLQGTELRGKTLGIVGLGRIGMEVARRARAFGMEIGRA